MPTSLCTALRRTRSEERLCRFCKHELPDWKTVLSGPSLPPADPIMVVTLGSVVHKIRVKPGEEGQREFQREIRRLFNIPDSVDFEVRGRKPSPLARRRSHLRVTTSARERQRKAHTRARALQQSFAARSRAAQVTFRCKAPCTTDTIQLEGMSSYHAATHCASLMAAQRMAASSSSNPAGGQQGSNAAHAHANANQVAAPSAAGTPAASLPASRQEEATPATSSLGDVASTPAGSRPQLPGSTTAHVPVTRARSSLARSSLPLPTPVPFAVGSVPPQAASTPAAAAAQAAAGSAGQRPAPSLRGADRLPRGLAAASELYRQTLQGLLSSPASPKAAAQDAAAFPGSAALRGRLSHPVTALCSPTHTPAQQQQQLLPAGEASAALAAAASPPAAQLSTGRHLSSRPSAPSSLLNLLQGCAATTAATVTTAALADRGCAGLAAAAMAAGAMGGAAPPASMDWDQGEPQQQEGKPEGLPGGAAEPGQAAANQGSGGGNGNSSAGSSPMRTQSPRMVRARRSRARAVSNLAAAAAVPCPPGPVSLSTDAATSSPFATLARASSLPPRAASPPPALLGSGPPAALGPAGAGFTPFALGAQPQDAAALLPPPSSASQPQQQPLRRLKSSLAAPWPKVSRTVFASATSSALLAASGDDDAAMAPEEAQGDASMEGVEGDAEGKPAAGGPLRRSPRNHPQGVWAGRC